MASPPASRVETSWNTATQVLVAVLVVNGLTVMPVFLVKAARYLVVWAKSLGVTGRPMFRTSSAVEEPPPPPEDPQAARSGPAAEATAAALTPADRKSRRPIPRMPAARWSAAPL